ncbi:hypothetical protein [Burkholderia sp. LMG 13014]|uniref:hypothetical protein n=1 Tax=Burkholderia sp. LMG 13014 TaxID=2709306 RepID=UPI001962805C|nr:hypothetical protein [Burkholderia sp. LMG 13014]
MTRKAKVVIAALACSAVVGLAGCGSHDHIDLGGVKIGMTRDEVAAAAPPGSTVYCRGEGDQQFEDKAHLPPSTSGTWCTWATGTAPDRSTTPVMIGATPSTEVMLVFGPDGQIASVAVGTAPDSFGAVVKSLEDTLGSPDSDLGIGGVKWKRKDGTLAVSSSGMGSANEMTVLLLTPTRPQAGS